MAKSSKKLPDVSSPRIAHNHITMNSAETGELATRLTAFCEARDTWRDEQREAIKGGAKATAFPESKIPDPNKHRMSHSAYAKLLAQWNDGDNVVVGPKYNPVTTELNSATGCRVVGFVQKQKSKPRNWDEDAFGSWFHEDEEGERTIPTSLAVKVDSRACHSDNIFELIEREEGTKLSDDNPHVVTIGNCRYIVGGGKHADAAVFLLNAHRPGSNYGNIEAARKRLSLDGVKNLVNLVGRIEDRPNCGGAVRVKLGGSEEVCFMPGEVVTWGYLANGKELTPSQIRKASDEKTKGVKFAALKEDIVGKKVDWPELWTEIKAAEGTAGQKAMRDRPSEYEGTTPQNKSIANSRTILRTNPMTEFHPFSFRSVQIGLMPFQVVYGLGEYDFTQGVVVGARCSFDYSTTLSEYKRELREAEAAEEAPAAPKRKAAKKKSAKKKATVAAVTEDAPAEEEEAPVLAIADDDGEGEDALVGEGSETED